MEKGYDLNTKGECAMDTNEKNIEKVALLCKNLDSDTDMQNNFMKS